MLYEPRDYSHLLGLQGFSDELLKTHFGLYQKYVEKTNEILSLLDEFAGTEELSKIQYGEVRRRLGWEFNGIRLHEYYFENLTKEENELLSDAVLLRQINKDFGSFENWKKDFVTAGMTRGIGWVVLYFDQIQRRLFNVWVNEHDQGHFAGAEVILVMDCWEHAYMTDYGTKRAEYIESFFKNIHWGVVSSRFTNES